MTIHDFLDILHAYRAKRAEELEGMAEEERVAEAREMTEKYAEKYGLTIVESTRRKRVKRPN